MLLLTELAANVGWGPAKDVPTLCFDVGSPLTYLRAEDADRLVPRLRWRPVADAQPARRFDRADVEWEAERQGMPLVWPDDHGATRKRRAARVASLACEVGTGADFVLAASRLAYCGGYDIDDLDVLAVAAASAEIDRTECTLAAADTRRDRALVPSGREAPAESPALPAIEFGERLYALESGQRLIPVTPAAAVRRGREKVTLVAPALREAGTPASA